MKVDLPIWQLNEALRALDLAEEKYMKESNYNKMFAFIAEKYGLDAAKKEKQELEESQFHPLGRIAMTRKSLCEAREAITENFNQVNKK